MRRGAAGGAEAEAEPHGNDGGGGSPSAGRLSPAARPSEGAERHHVSTPHCNTHVSALAHVQLHTHGRMNTRTHATRQFGARVSITCRAQAVVMYGLVDRIVTSFQPDHALPINSCIRAGKTLLARRSTVKKNIDK